MNDGRLPLAFSARDAKAGERARIALVLTSDRAVPRGYALVRHADAAAVARSGACPCCRVPSGIVAVLRQLFIERARGEVDFAAVLVSGSDVARLRAEAGADAFIAARYAIAPPPD